MIRVDPDALANGQQDGHLEATRPTESQIESATVEIRGDLEFRYVNLIKSNAFSTNDYSLAIQVCPRRSGQ
jgi:hypothetical protein